MEYLSYNNKDHPNQNKNSHKSIIMWWNWASRFEFDRKLMETETTWLEFANGVKVLLELVEQILVSKDLYLKGQDCKSHSQGFR